MSPDGVPSLSTSPRIFSRRSMLERESISSRELEEGKVETIPSFETRGVSSGTSSEPSTILQRNDPGDELRAGRGSVARPGRDRVLPRFPREDDLDRVPLLDRGEPLHLQNGEEDVVRLRQRHPAGGDDRDLPLHPLVEDEVLLRLLAHELDEDRQFDVGEVHRQVRRGIGPRGPGMGREQARSRSAGRLPGAGTRIRTGAASGAGAGTGGASAAGAGTGTGGASAAPAFGAGSVFP